MKTIAELLNDGVESIILKILVFGPQVKSFSTDTRTLRLQHKRIQIRQELESCGHYVKYAEELVDPALPPPLNNAFLQELIIMKDYDLIINIVDKPGSISEATAIALKPELAPKSCLFLDASYSDGLTDAMCCNAETLGADFIRYTYPSDLVDCNLVGFVKTKVRAIQIVHYLS